MLVQSNSQNVSSARSCSAISDVHEAYQADHGKLVPKQPARLRDLGFRWPRQITSGNFSTNSAVLSARRPNKTPRARIFSHAMENIFSTRASSDLPTSGPQLFEATFPAGAHRKPAENISKVSAHFLCCSIDFLQQGVESENRQQDADRCGRILSFAATPCPNCQTSHNMRAGIVNMLPIRVMRATTVSAKAMRRGWRRCG